MKEVLLFSENCIHETVTIAAQIDENGRLLVLGNDCFKDNEKEYCYLIDNENTKKLAALLCYKKSTSFLEVLGETYGGSDSCERIMEFCKEHGISYHYLEVE